MCIASNVGVYYEKKFTDKYPNIHEWVIRKSPGTATSDVHALRIEFEMKFLEFKNEILHELNQLKKLMEAANDFDQQTDQPNCRDDQKYKLIKHLAELLDVDMQDVLK